MWWSVGNEQDLAV